MKKARKIIPALAMLLVAAVMMSTASFAWFSMNTTATATGMQIKATSSGGLAIAVNGTKNAAPADGSAYKTSVDMTNAWTNEATAVEPVSNSYGTDNWFYGTAASVDDYAIASDGTYTTIGTINPAGADKQGAGYFFHTQVFVKSLSEAHKTGATGPLKVSAITLKNGNTTGAGANLEKALRVAVRYTDGGTVKWLYFAPKASAAAVTELGYVKDADTAAKYGASDNMFIGDTKTGSTGDNFTKTYGTTNGVLFAGGTGSGLTYDTPVQIDIFVYFEGEDVNCTTQNAIDLKNISVTIDFTIPTT